MAAELYRPQPRFDVLRWPVVGRLLRWRWGRLAVQSVTVLLAILFVYDGFTGPQFAPENLATVGVWLHYRGLVVLALLLAGNLFCMGCPFTVPRTLARRVSRAGRRWPQRLRNKWVAISVLGLYFFLYEWLALWATPYWTAWIIIGYFVAAFLLEAIFTESAFCKYVCPLGTFNYLGSTISPTQITVRSADTCRTCVGKECINGSADVLGCGTLLFAPQITSNLDCTLCLDCVRACPHDNVALAVRGPLHEASRPRALPQRWDITALIWVFAAAGLANAFGMVPPFFALQASWRNLLGADAAWPGLLLTFLLTTIVAPVALAITTAWLSRRLAGTGESLRATAAAMTPALLPLAFAIWLAHYLFHFATGALSIVPVTQSFLADHGIRWFGAPNWALSAALPLDWLPWLTLLTTLGGLGASLVVLSRLGRRTDRPPLALLPWALALLLIATLALQLFNLPMEMRGTSFLN